MTTEEPRREQPGENTQSLIARHQAGDSNALQTLIERYYARIERIVRVRLGPALLQRSTVEDVLQDVLVRVVEGIETYERRTDARWIDWVAGLVQHEIANQARSASALKRGGPTARLLRQYAESASSWDVPDDATGVQSKVARKEETAIVDACVSELAEAHREVILLRDYAGGDWRTVAEQMGRPSPEACQELHRRARRELAQKLRSRL